MTADQNDARYKAAIEAYRRQDLNRAAALLETLLAEFSDDAKLLQQLGAIDVQRDKLESALIYLERALKLAPESAEILNALGQIHKKAGRPQKAEKSFQKAISAKPDHSAAYVSLAALYEREHRFDEALALAERAVKLAPSHRHANLTLAQIELRMGKAEKAIQNLEQLIAASANRDAVTAVAQYLLGQARHKLGAYDNAFTAYQAGNDTLYQMYRTSIEAMPSTLSPQFLHNLYAFFSIEDISAWTTVKKLEEPAPVFLMGFPRSGTTLLDQILSAHSAIGTLEEKRTLIDARNDLIRPEGALEKLCAMTDEKVNSYRKKYWTRAREEIRNASISGELVIDKLPLNTILLGLIYRLFPDAKVIFALRDPRDVVLSCFQQRFGMNAAMFQLLKLDSAAMYYDQVMSLAEVYRARLPLNLHVVRYEDVVGDIKKTVSDLLGFLGLEWEDGILEYRNQAHNRWISTPSSEQVIQPLYGSSIGKWRNYQRHMETIMPILEPWVEKYGYNVS